MRVVFQYAFSSQKPNKKLPEYQGVLMFKLLTSLFDSNRNSNGHAGHGVVARADKPHHFNV